MERCTKSDAISVSGSAKKPYIVSFADPTAPTCTCVSFAIGRNRAKARVDGRKYKNQGNTEAWCKHIDKEYDNACMWRGTTLIPGICPRCGSKTVALNEPAVAVVDSIAPVPQGAAPDITGIEEMLRDWTK